MIKLLKGHSFWAQCHPVKAVAIAILVNCVLLLLCVLLGFIFYGFSISLPAILWVLAFVLLVSCAFAYPDMSIRHLPLRYEKQKLCEAGIMIAACICITTSANRWIAHQPITFIESTAIHAAPLAKQKTSEAGTTINWTQKELKKIWKKFSMNDAEGKVNWRAIVLLFLVLIAIAAGLVVLLAIYCGFACSGQYVLAIIFTALGGVGLGIGVYFWVKQIVKKYFKHKRLQVSS